MGNFRKKQGGFTAVEGLLVVLVLAVIGFGGYFVWHAQNTKTANLATTTKISSTPKSNATKQPTANTAPTQGYLIITEWGVKLPISGALATAQYQDITAASGEQYSTMQVAVTGAATNDTCEGGVVGRISRIPDSAAGASRQNTISHIGSYNYVYIQAPDCTASPTSAVIAQFTQAVGKMVST